MTKPQGRIQSVDSLRLIALFGINVVNLPFMAMPSARAMAAPAGSLDLAVAVVVELLFQMKFFLLFSFLYGWGLERQFRGSDSERVERSHWRRMKGLAVGGALHGALVFSGDILLLYALCGSVLWRVRDWTTDRRLKAARTWLIGAGVTLLVLGALSTFLPDEAVPGATVAARSFASALIERLFEWPVVFIFLVILQGPLVLAAMLVGMSARREGWLQNADSPLRKGTRPHTNALWALAALNLIFAGQSLLQGNDVTAFGILLSALSVGALAVAAPALAVLYLRGLLNAFDRFQPPMWARRAGANSLSVYVLQGVLSQALMDAWGLGLYDQCNRMELVGLSLVVTSLSIALVSVWARWMERGPLEAVLRRWVRG